jgi:hypothetical protein
VSDLFDYYGIPINVKLNAIVTRAEAIMSGQIASQWLGPTHVRPLRQPLQYHQNPPMNPHWKPLDLPKGLGQGSDLHVNNVAYRQ